MAVYPLLVPDIEAATPNETLANALVKFGLQDVHQLPVVDSEGRVIGILNRSSTIHRYQQEIVLHREQD